MKKDITRKRNGYSKYLSYYLDEDYIIESGGLPTPDGTMRCPLPFLWGKEPPHVNTYEADISVDEYSAKKVATVAVFSFARSRKWNIGRMSILLNAELLDENFFDYHSEQLLKLFDSKNKYRTAMREIERRCGLEYGYCCKV